MQTANKTLMRELPHTRSCFVCGEANPIGLKLRFETDGQVVRARFVPCAEHAGFRHTVHGGLVATVLDEIMVWACAVQARRFAFCAELNVRFQHPVRPDQEMWATSKLVENRRDKIFIAEAQLREAAGEICASATGKYLPVKETQTADLAEDFIGDASWVLASSNRQQT